MAKKNKKDQALHGNSAKIDPAGAVTSLYQSNTVTMSDRKQHETPLVDEKNVEYIKKFVEVNEK